jgi:hypothetical protein
MATTHGLTSDGLIALSDVDLLMAFRKWIGRVDDCHTMDALYFLFDEALERFAPPEAQQVELERFYMDDTDDIDDDLLNLQAALDARRRRHAARLIRETFDEEGGDDG